MTPSSLHEERKGRGFFSDLEVNFLVLTGTDSPVCRVQTPDTTRAGRHDVRSRGSQGGRGVAATRRARSRAAVPGRRAPHRQHIAAPRRGLQPSYPRVHLRAVPQCPQRHDPRRDSGVDWHPRGRRGACAGGRRGRGGRGKRRRHRPDDARRPLRLVIVASSRSSSLARRRSAVRQERGTRR